MAELPAGHAASRRTLHRIAAHVLGRRRYQLSGRFGLRASPGGFATPAFGEAPEVLRVSGVHLVRDRGEASAGVRIPGNTMRGLAAFAGADLGSDFSTGAETPDLGDVDEPLELDGEAVGVLAGWLSVGSRALDGVLASLADGSDPATVQLWPEHFDLGTNVTVAGPSRTNLGASLGDSTVEEPYLYVGPWDSERPGDPTFWNASFGAVLRWSDIEDGDDPVGRALEFFEEGLRNLDGPPA